MFTRDPNPHPHTRPVPASRDPRHLDILPIIMQTICSREILTKKCRQQQNFDSDPREAWHYNQVTFTPIAKNFMLYCRLIYVLSMLYVRLTIKVKVGILESFKVR